jgi:hypothetical protein
MMLKASPAENRARTPTLPPTAAAKVATFRFLAEALDVVVAGADSVAVEGGGDEVVGGGDEEVFLDEEW